MYCTASTLACHISTVTQHMLKYTKWDGKCHAHQCQHLDYTTMMKNETHINWSNHENVQYTITRLHHRRAAFSIWLGLLAGKPQADVIIMTQ